MKRLEVTVARGRLRAVKDALVQHGFDGITVSEVLGVRRPVSRIVRSGDADSEDDFVRKIRIEVIVSCEDDLRRALDLIVDKVPVDPEGDDNIMLSEIYLMVVR
jgi:nitrogen regulatory protein P-II 1